MRPLPPSQRVLSGDSPQSSRHLSVIKSAKLSREEDPERTNVAARDRGINTFTA